MTEATSEFDFFLEMRTISRLLDYVNGCPICEDITLWDIDRIRFLVLVFQIGMPDSNAIIETANPTTPEEATLLNFVRDFETGREFLHRDIFLHTQYELVASLTPSVLQSPDQLNELLSRVRKQTKVIYRYMQHRAFMQPNQNVTRLHED